MFENIRDKIRELVRSLDYVMSLHAEEEMENDSLSILDIESVLFSGKITERQLEPLTRESKYLVCGRTLDDLEVTVVAKLSLMGKLVIITVFKTEGDEYEH